MTYRAIQSGFWAIALTLVPMLAPTQSEAAPSFRVPSLEQRLQARPPLRHSLPFEGSIYNMDFTPDGNFVATSHSDGSVRLWAWRDGVQHLRFDRDTDNTVFSWVDITPDGQYFVTSKSNGTVQLREIGSGVVTQELPINTRGSGIVMVTADGKTLVNATGLGSDFSISLWDMETQQEHQNLGGYRADYAAITPNGYTLVSASSSGTASVWDLRQGKRISTLPPGATEGITALAICPDRRAIYTAHSNGTIKQWNAQQGRLERTLLTTRTPAKALAVSGDRQTLAISFGNYIQLRNLPTNQPRYNLASNAPGPQIMSFSPDGRYFLNTDGANDQSRLRIWQIP
ncbi:WD40 repeat domain-containing protein [Leptolyngbya sp. AN02str]|uniref:WD40 repeat domain-containing protein n=1 Tax=Leptolyngbya sp. AN02str TaxID=3423363 RepID=UPI003D31AA31